MISIKCIRGAGDREAARIQDDLITTEHIARLRGAAYLDQVYYDRTGRSVTAPFKPVQDGQVVRISDPLIAVGNYHARSVRIRITRPDKIDVLLEVEGEYADPA